jgi:hypothetical protein
VLVLPAPANHRSHEDKGETLETEAMKQVIGLYGKTGHFWEVDKGHELPLGRPRRMGSMAEGGQTNMDEAWKDRNKRVDVDHQNKAGTGPGGGD